MTRTKAEMGNKLLKLWVRSSKVEGTWSLPTNYAPTNDEYQCRHDQSNRRKINHSLIAIVLLRRGVRRSNGCEECEIITGWTNVSGGFTFNQWVTILPPARDFSVTNYLGSRQSVLASDKTNFLLWARFLRLDKSLYFPTLIYLKFNRASWHVFTQGCQCTASQGGEVRCK
jgi:hypothetical protein